MSKNLSSEAAHEAMLALGKAQAVAYELRIPWNEDYRGWEYDPECLCERCSRINREASGCV